VLAYFALEHGSRVLCYANANLTRAEQAAETSRFVEFWRERRFPEGVITSHESA